MTKGEAKEESEAHTKQCVKAKEPFFAQVIINGEQQPLLSVPQKVTHQCIQL